MQHHNKSADRKFVDYSWESRNEIGTNEIKQRSDSKRVKMISSSKNLMSGNALSTKLKKGLLLWPAMENTLKM
jgi:hypothetical protein